MKKFGLSMLLALYGFIAYAQNTANSPVKFPALDTSPLDALYYPVNAVKVKKEEASMPIIKVLYSRPAKKGREIFGILEQFGKVWRLGANENTEIYFSKPVTVGQKRIKPGKYSLFAIPNKETWTIIVNKQTDRWGVFSYNPEKDVVRVEVAVQGLEKPIENFSMTFSDIIDGAKLIMAWDTTQVELPIYFKKN